MPSSSPRQMYPLYSTGIPRWIERVLRGAGLPVDELTTVKWMREFNRGDRPEALVLFDSRTPASRQNAETFQRHGCCTLDVAAFLRTTRPRISLDSGSAESTVLASRRLRILDRAKEQIEAAGFLWTRIADYPFPFQAALCDARRDRAEDSGRHRSQATTGERIHPAALTERPSLPMPLTGTKNSSAPECPQESLHEQYAAGGTVYLPGDLKPEELETADGVLEGEGLPLMWRTSPEEFARWRRLRSRCEFEIVARGRRLEIRGTLPSSKFRPALEIWRGRHFAVLPLKDNRQRIDTVQLVYQSAGRRHPAGIAAADAEMEHHAALLSAAANAV